DPFGRGHPDRAAQEAEFADHHCDPASEDPPFAGQYRFVQTGRGPGVGQLPRIGGAERHGKRLTVPAGEGILVQHRVAQLGSRDTTHVTRLYRVAATIGVSQAEAVLTIELQRPERRNALNSQLVEELREAVS